MKIPLFDIDGTVLEYASIKAHHDAFTYAFEEVYGVKATTDEIEGSGKLDNKIIIEVLSLHGISEEKVKNKLSLATKTMAEYFLQHQDEDEYIVLPGVKKLLEILKHKSVPVGLLTGNVEEIGWGKMEMAGLRDYFDFGAFGNLAFRRVDLIKIAEERARKLTHLNIPDYKFVIVGDSLRDIECARQGKIKVIAVPTGIHTKNDLEKHNPDLLVNSLEETGRILKFLEVK